MPGPCPARGSTTTNGRRVGSISTPARRHDAHQPVIDRPLERAAVEDQLDLVVEDVRRRLRQMLAILVAALAHDVPEQDAALRGIDHVFDRRARTVRRTKQVRRRPLS